MQEFFLVISKMPSCLSVVLKTFSFYCINQVSTLNILVSKSGITKPFLVLFSLLLSWFGPNKGCGNKPAATGGTGKMGDRDSIVTLWEHGPLHILKLWNTVFNIMLDFGISREYMEYMDSIVTL